MHRPTLLATLAGASLLSSEAAFAHGFAGPHLFISTLMIDDPNVADEASLPTFSVLPQPNDGGPVPDLYAAEFEFDKRITENFGFSVSDGYQWLHPAWHARPPPAGRNLEVTLKYKPYVNAEHEFMVSVGVCASSRAPAPPARMARCWTTTTAVPPRRRSIGARVSAICRSAGPARSR